MKKNLPYLLCCILALVQVSCTSQLYINTVKPPEVAVTNAQWKVVAVNRYNPSLLTFNQEKKIAVFANGANEAFRGAVAAIMKDETFVLVHSDTSTYRAQAEQEQLTAGQVQEIYRQHPHHLLLSMDYFNTFFDQETVREEDEDGDVTKTAHYTLITRSYWTLYDSTGTVLDKITLSEEAPYQSRSVLSGLLAIGPSMGNAGPEVNGLAWNSGLRYWSRLSPQTVTYVRPYYSTKNLQYAAFKMATSDWASAISLLQPIADGEHKKDAARAAYNLAVVYEAMGNKEQAKHWARQAKQRNDKLAILLLPQLENY
ncbi:DUF6340 family protein [Pontibacter akesuensis]|uniref:Tetratricopeptide repeat-containing protein n=1 Tax=Pontibacter akesuensis TaxID=388950 RepID=A0A1I7FPA3_9BACT|nr:DUF6340 family protein [Pontibacter akesuensis]GHA61167.1 hypothetical protein GCM10007389_11970 [Pontibacter akesuensis]SFU38024.1 hypothetical protein SAMN04487941_0365 [Pontibacter akesuensis]